MFGIHYVKGVGPQGLTVSEVDSLYVLPTDFKLLEALLPEGTRSIELDVDDFPPLLGRKTQEGTSRRYRYGQLNGRKGLANLRIAVKRHHAANRQKRLDDERLSGSRKGQIIGPAQDCVHREE